MDILKIEKVKTMEHVAKWIFCILLNILGFIKKLSYSFCNFCRDILWVFTALIIGSLLPGIRVGYEKMAKVIVNDFSSNEHIIGVTLTILIMVFLLYTGFLFVLFPFFKNINKDLFTGEWTVYRDNNRIEIIHEKDMLYYTHEISEIISLGETYILAEDEVANVYRNKGYINICDRETGKLKRNLQLHNTIIKFKEKGDK